jgi:hypothetical protein
MRTETNIVLRVKCPLLSTDFEKIGIYRQILEEVVSIEFVGKPFSCYGIVTC